MAAMAKTVRKKVVRRKRKVKVRKIAPKGTFAKKSFRTVQTPKGRLVIGCPKGEWDEKKQLCRVGTRGHKLVYNSCKTCKLRTNPTKERRQWYVGSSVKTNEYRMFQSKTEPIRSSHGRTYHFAIGPFRTKAGAAYMAKYGKGNPHLRHVEDAERFARLEKARKKKGEVKRTVRRIIKKATRKNPLVGVNPRRRKSRINPKALAMFRKIHGCDPDKIVKVGSGDENLIVLGEVLEVAYNIPFATKRDKGNTEWVHKFKKKPILALTPSGKPCILFMKDHKITSRGLIG